MCWKQRSSTSFSTSIWSENRFSHRHGAGRFELAQCPRTRFVWKGGTSNVFGVPQIIYSWCQHTAVWSSNKIHTNNNMSNDQWPSGSSNQILQTACKRKSALLETKTHSQSVSFVARASHCLRDTNMAWTSSLASRAVSPTQKSIKLVYCTVQTWNSQAHGTSKQSKSPKSKNRFRWLMQQISSNAFLCPKSAIPIRSLSQPMQQYNALMRCSYIISSNDSSNFANVGQC